MSTVTRDVKFTRFVTQKLRDFCVHACYTVREEKPLRQTIKNKIHTIRWVRGYVPVNNPRKGIANSNHTNCAKRSVKNEKNKNYPRKPVRNRLSEKRGCSTCGDNETTRHRRLFALVLQSLSRSAINFNEALRAKNHVKVAS